MNGVKLQHQVAGGLPEGLAETPLICSTLLQTHNAEMLHDTLLACSRHTLQAPGTQGSLLYSFVQTDDYADKAEGTRKVTTSDHEHTNWLAAKLLANSKTRQQVLNFRSMHIMADLAGEQDTADVNQKV